MAAGLVADTTSMRKMLRSPYVGLVVSVLGFSLGGGAALLRSRSSYRSRF
jgi:hypothetical protein